MKHFLIALQFLTIIPVNIKGTIKEEDYGKALLYFPLIGNLIGYLLALSLFIFNFLPDSVNAALILIISAGVTQGLHLDGFIDACDGLWGYHEKEKALEIMRDSRVGAMGTIGVTLLLLFKYSLLLHIPQKILWEIIILMPVFSRWVQVLVCFTSKPARNDSKAVNFILQASKREVLIGLLFTLGLFLALLRLKGFLLFTTALSPIFLLKAYLDNKIGGMTGDTIGALSEIAEVSILFLTLILYTF